MSGKAGPEVRPARPHVDVLEDSNNLEKSVLVLVRSQALIIIAKRSEFAFSQRVTRRRCDASNGDFVCFKLSF